MEYEDLTKLSFTIESLNQIKQKIIQNNIKFNLNILCIKKYFIPHNKKNSKKK